MVVDEPVPGSGECITALVRWDTQRLHIPKYKRDVCAPVCCMNINNCMSAC